MFEKISSADTSILPNDVLSLRDENFYDIVRKIAGVSEATLLEIQGIRSAYSFLNTDDVFAILSIPCSALSNVKKTICLELDDQTLVVKPGCRSGIEYLHQLLYQRHEEHLKQKVRRSKGTKNVSTNLAQASSTNDAPAGATSQHQSTPSEISMEFRMTFFLSPNDKTKNDVLRRNQCTYRRKLGE